MSRFIVHTEEEQTLRKILDSLKEHPVASIDGQPGTVSIGWVPYGQDFGCDWETASIMIGTSIVFTMRMDKKQIPGGIVKKYVALETKKRLQESGREFLSKNERGQIKDFVLDKLQLKFPATPSFFDVVWNVEDRSLTFMSAAKGPLEEFATLFARTFKGVRIVPEIPYTLAIKGKTRDIIGKITELNRTIYGR